MNDQTKPDDLPVGDLAGATETGDSLSRFWIVGGVLVVAAIFAGSFAYRRRRGHPERREHPRCPGTGSNEETASKASADPGWDPCDM